MGRKVVEHLRYFIDCILDIIYCCPENCIICSEYKDEDSYLCESCIKKITPSISYTILSKGVDLKCYSYAYYSGIIKELILNFKYKSDFNSGDTLSNFIVNVYREYGLHCDLVTFVPSTRKVYKKRGFNQSEVLAKFLSKKINKPMKNTLIKVKNTEDQIGLYGEERWNNIKGSFSIKDINLVKDKVIVLIDDVITTGATVYNCSETLLNSGAKSVHILTVAKSKL